MLLLELMIVRNKNNILEHCYTVYIHLFPNGKNYVGITSQYPEDRWRKGRGYIGQSLVYNAIKKYGWENIEHFIFASNLTGPEALNMEKILIQKLKSNNRQYGYNITIGGEQSLKYNYKEIVDLWLSGLNIKQISKEIGCSLPIISEALNSYNIPMSIRKAQGGLASGKKVGQYDLNNNFIREYSSTCEASRLNAFNQSNISACCRGKRKTASGYIWRYLDE